MNVRLGQTSKR